MSERKKADNDLYSVRLNHAIVFNSAISDFEKIKQFITEETNSKLIFEKHAAHFLKIVDAPREEK